MADGAVVQAQDRTTAATTHARRRRVAEVVPRFLMVVFVLALLYPLAGLAMPVGPWRWDHEMGASTAEAVRVSLSLTALALLIIVALGTPAAYYLSRLSGLERTVFEGAILLSVLMPPLALGLMLSLAFGPTSPVGAYLMRLGVPTSNSAVSFVATQVYVGMGYYVIAARAAFASVPRELEMVAGLLGLRPLAVFRRVTFPLARLGLAAAASIAWVRSLGEFGAVLVTSYYPGGIPVRIWVNLQEAGLPAVMPLLLLFVLSALPLPWLVHILAHRRDTLDV